MLSKRIKTFFFVLVLQFGAWAYLGFGGYASPHLMSDAVHNFSDWTSLTNNPALLTEVDQKEISLGGLRLVEDAGFSFLSLAYPIYFRHTAAATFFSSSLQKIPLTSYEGDPLPGSLSFNDWNIILSYAFRLLPSISLGTNLNILGRDLGEAIGDYTGLQPGIGFDFGIVWNPLNHYRAGNLNLGLNLQNAYNTGIKEGTEAAEKTRFPVNIRFCSSYRLFRNRFILNMEGIILDMLVRKSDFNEVVSGTTVDLTKVYRPVLLSGNARYFLLRGAGVKAGLNNNRLPFLGVVFIFKRINVFRWFQIDYDWWIDNKGAGWSNMLKLATRVGRTREEMLSKKLYSKLIIAPMQDFEDAMRLYLAGMYWEAAFAFGKLIALYPGFHKIDMAAFYLGKCYEYMEMNKSARAIYVDALKKYTTSDMRPRYLYQIQNLDYKEGRFDNALKNYAFITNLYGATAIRSEADYVAGQIYFNRKNYNQARQVLSKVPAEDETFPYAQYTLAMISLKEKNVPGAIQHLNNVVAVQPQSASDQVLFEAACTKMGHIYFEDVRLNEAISFYQKVPLKSKYADEALLAMAWSFVKTNRKEMFRGAIGFADQLLSSHSKSPLVPEAYLVKGYCLTQLGEFEAATKEFRRCIELCQTPMASESEIQRKIQEFKQVQQGFGKKEVGIMRNALQRPNENVLAARPEMEHDYQQFQENQKERLLFEDRINRIRKLRKTRNKLLEDARFALATVDNLAKSQRKKQIMDEFDKEQKEIDQEILELQRELQQLE